MNNTLLSNNVSVGCQSNESSHVFRTAMTLAYCVILAVSLAGNSLLVLVIYKNHTMRTTINYFMVNMAVSDLLFAIFVIPRSIAEIFTNTWLIQGISGDILCKLTHFIQDVSTAASIESLVVIAVDRYRAVVFPTKPTFITPKIRRVLIVMTWAWGIGFHVPYLHAFKTREVDNSTYCLLDWGLNHLQAMKTYFLVASLNLFVVPLLAMLVLYSLIVLKLQRRRGVLNNTFSSSSSRNLERRNRSVMKAIIAVVVSFVLCWLPFNVGAYLVFFLWELKPPCHIKLFSTVAVFLAHTNSAINPCLIFGFSSAHRELLRDMCMAPRTRSPRVHQSKAFALSRRHMDPAATVAMASQS